MFHLLAIQTTIDWSAVGKTWGPLGIIFVLAVILIYGGARLLRSTLTETITDARKERDSAKMLLTEQARTFTESLRFRDEKFKDVVDALDRIGRRRA